MRRTCIYYVYWANTNYVYIWFTYVWAALYVSSSKFPVHGSSVNTGVYLQNTSRPPLGKHVCIEVILVFEVHIWIIKIIHFFGLFVQKFLGLHSANIYLPFQWWKWTIFVVNKSRAIHFHIAFHINSQSDLILICNWTEMSEPQFFCTELVKIPVSIFL